MGKKVAVAGAGLVVLALLGQLIFNRVYNFPKQVEYGVSFSPKYAKYLQLDWKKIYLAMLDEANIKLLRLPTYWDEIEATASADNFSDTDFMLDEAGKKNAKVLLVLGVRQPRWPECHIPKWAKELSVAQRKQKILQFIRKVLERYEDKNQIFAWQVENEPFLRFFGEGCVDPDKAFLKQEVS